MIFPVKAAETPCPSLLAKGHFVASPARRPVDYGQKGHKKVSDIQPRRGREAPD
jgi:hypothetical protein